jgi:hypothetical protein
LDRGIARASQLLHAIIGVLGERQIGGRGLDRGFALRDHLGPCACLDIGKLRRSDCEARFGLSKLGDELGIVDLEEKLPGADIVTSRNRALGDLSIHASGDVDPSGVGLALNNEGLRLDKVPERQPDYRGDDQRNDDRRPARDFGLSRRNS